jgi:hypothetical protein
MANIIVSVLFGLILGSVVATTRILRRRIDMIDIELQSIQRSIALLISKGFIK